MKDLIVSLLPIIALQLLALVAALFVHVQSPGRSVVRLLVVPLALACVMGCPFLFTQLMGYSVSWPLPDKFTFLSYQPVVKAGRKTDLEIWLRDGAATRLHRAPYSQELEKLLQDAAKGSKGGRQAKIEKRGRGQPGQDQSKAPMGPYELSFISPSDIPKDMPPDAPMVPREPPPDEPVTKRYSI
jgi:hypothetical protein